MYDKYSARDIRAKEKIKIKKLYMIEITCFEYLSLLNLSSKKENPLNKKSFFLYSLKSSKKYSTISATIIMDIVDILSYFFPHKIWPRIIFSIRGNITMSKYITICNRWK